MASPEHALVYCESDKILIAGDQILSHMAPSVMVPSAQPEANPMKEYLDALTRLEALSPDTLVLPSHGLPFRGISLRVAQLRAHHDARLAELEHAIAAAAGPVTAAQMIPVLFRRELDLQQRFFAIGEAIAHLNHLWHHQRLRRTLSAAGILHFST